MELLSKCDTESAYKLVHGLLDGVCGRVPPQYGGYAQIFSLEDWWVVTDALRGLCTDAARDSFSQDAVRVRCAALPAALQAVVTEALLMRAADVRAALVESSSTIAQTSLTDFDWKLKLAVASSRLASIHQPLISLDLELQPGRGAGGNQGVEETSRLVSVEMGREELKKLVGALEAANKAVMQLKTH